MQTKLLKLNRLYVIALLLMAPVFTVNAQLNFDVDASTNWVGYANVFDTDEEQTFMFGSSWDVADLKTVINTGDNTITLYPNYNTYNASDAYWANGEYGAKIFEGSTYTENTEWAGQDVTFTGFVESNTIIEDYTVLAFVKALNPDNNYSLDVYYNVPLVEGENFSITVPAEELPEGLLVQIGFSVTGLNGNPDHEEQNGNVVVTANQAGTDSFATAKVKLYPNPAKNLLNIQSQDVVNEVEIYNMLGQKVLATTSAQTATAVNVSSLAPGIYTINMQSAQGKTSMRFIKE